VSDRVVVMHERRITGVLEGSALTQLGIAGLMTGRPANSGGSGEAVAS
jgi:ABC-type sugar transport system ATPase subunit